MADVLFGQFVVCQIQCGEALLAKALGNLGGLARALGGQADKHMGLRCIVHAVVELGHIAGAARQFANQSAKAAKAAALFRNRHGKQRFALFTHFGALGDKAQAVEVHIGAAQNSSVGLALRFVRGGILLDGCYAQRTGRLDDGAGVHKNVFDGGAHRIGVHGHKFVHQTAGHAEGLFTHQLHRGAV